MKNALTLVFVLMISSCITNKKLDKLILAYDKAKQQTNERIDAGNTTSEVGNSILNNLENEKNDIMELKSKSMFARTFQAKANVKIKTSFANLELLQRVYNISEFKKFSSKKLFNTGEYVIPSQFVENILIDLDPLLDKIVATFKNETHRTIKVVIMVEGFSDEQTIAQNSQLYKDILREFPGLVNPTQDELNKKLSELRAKSLGDLIDKTVKQRNDNIKDIMDLRFQIYVYGRGTALPFKDNGNVQRDDPNRRVVKVLWDVNPFEKN